MTGSFKEMMDRVFSDEFVHADVNIVQLIMYRSAYPFAVLLKNLRLSPNLITTLAVIFSILAFAALAFDEGWAWFSVFWGVTVLLDFCDGTVARMTNQVSKQAFRYDHMSDLFKIFLLFLGTGVRYDTGLVWMVSITVLFLFMYFMILNHDIAFIRKLSNLMGPSANSDTDSYTSDATSGESRMRIRERYPIVGWLVKFKLLHKTFSLFWAPLTTINGHTLLLFFLLPFGLEYAVCGFAYLGLVALNGIRMRIGLLLTIPKP